MQIFRDDNIQVVKDKAKKELNKVLGNIKNESVLLLLSGGSSLDLVDDINKEVLGSHLTVSVLDERYSLNPRVNNFAQLEKKDFFNLAYESQVSFINTRVEGESLDDLAERFDSELKKWKKSNKKGKVIITQGIGHDGHTAGIFGYPEDKQFFNKLFEDKNKWAVGYDAGVKNEYSKRITVTIPFLRDLVDVSIVYAVGQDKNDVLDKVLSNKCAVYEIPACILQEMKDVRVFTDN